MKRITDAGTDGDEASRTPRDGATACAGIAFYLECRGEAAEFVLVEKHVTA